MANEIFGLIQKVMQDIGAVGKNRQNPQQGYSFRGIDDFLNAVHPVLAKHGIFPVPEVLEHTREERKTQKGGTLIYTIMRVKVTFFAPDGSSVAAVTIGEGMDSGDKSSNKAQSAALKYALIQTFCVPTDELRDSEEDSPQVAPKQPARQAAPPVKATAAQVKAMQALLESHEIPDETLQKWFAKAGVEAWADMPGVVIDKCIAHVKKQPLKQKANAAA